MLPVDPLASPSGGHTPAWQHQHLLQRSVWRTLPPCQWHLPPSIWQGISIPSEAGQTQAFSTSQHPLMLDNRSAARSTPGHWMTSLGTHRLHLDQLEAALVLLGTDCSEGLHLLPRHCLGHLRQQPAGTRCGLLNAASVLQHQARPCPVHVLLQSLQPRVGCCRRAILQHVQLRDALCRLMRSSRLRAGGAAWSSPVPVPSPTHAQADRRTSQAGHWRPS